ncbi:MAG TPA: diaminopimelate epimerase [Jatrophihabitantaceae bacterium]|nr:diaminopimelate epimerase [Jatrophihabitantaceae bacterium]
MDRLRVMKGHGTENDFVIVPDFEGALELTPELARALCDRHSGIGADGVLRAVRCENDPVGATMAGDAVYFMDYRNADGSVAEMCGNGVRVFVRYLQSVGVVVDSAAVATRGGVKRTWLTDEGGVIVDMGVPMILADRPVATAAPSVRRVAGVAVELPNPHVVVPVAGRDELDALDLSRPPRVEPTRPDGQNVEFVVREGLRQLRMRVHERGVGETRSCGTGICAAVAAADGAGPDGSTWTVDVPGGSCQVTWQPDGVMHLRGPAVLVADVELSADWLSRVQG